ncbi:MAG TPA: hypothetical protein VNO21_25190, partial [Polyangiaceae bacterium]|nr:hypothetical protein [Polyangiaceae bacterium]
MAFWTASASAPFTARVQASKQSVENAMVAQSRSLPHERWASMADCTCFMAVSRRLAHDDTAAGALAALSDFDAVAWAGGAFDGSGPQATASHAPANIHALE